MIWNLLILLVEHKGLEPLASWLPVKRSPNWANAPTLVVDPENIIQTIEINADGIGRKANVNINKIKAAKYVASHPGEACPAKWESEEDATLTPGLDLVGKI